MVDGVVDGGVVVCVVDDVVVDGVVVDVADDVNTVLEEVAGDGDVVFVVVLRSDSDVCVMLACVDVVMLVGAKVVGFASVDSDVCAIRVV